MLRHNASYVRVLNAAAVLTSVLLASPRAARALECGDFPAGIRINAYAEGHQTELGLAVGPGSILYAVWTDRRDPLEPAVYFSRSDDRGRTFGAGVPVAPGAGLRVAGAPLVAAGPGNQVMVVWAGEEGDNLQIWLARSLDRGKTFQPPVMVNDRDVGEESLPGLWVTPGGTTYVGWIEHPNEGEPNVRLARALPGQTFGKSVQVNQGVVSSSCECCTIDLTAVGEDRVSVTFMGNLSYVRDLYVSTSIDGGRTFADPVQVNDGHWFEPACPTSGPSIESDPAGNLHAVWLDRHDFAPEAGMYYARSTNGGVTFTPPVPLHEPGGSVTGHPSLAFTTDETIHVVWEFYNFATSALNLDYASSKDGGETFSPPCPLAGGAPYFQWTPSAIAWPDFGFAIGWHDDRAGASDVYVSTPGSTTSVPSTSPGQAALALHASPNPFNLGLEITIAGDVTAGASSGPRMLVISDVLGRRVRLLALEGQALRWDGRDERGQEVPAGSYFLQTSLDAPALKVVRLR